MIMSKFLITDELTKDVYPANSAYDVEEAILYLVGEELTGAQEAELEDILTMSRLMNQGHALGVTLAYPELNISFRSTE